MRLRWPQSMLGRNLLLLLPLTLASQLCAASIWWLIVQRPRLDDAAAMFASQIRQTDRLLSTLSPTDRRGKLRQMNAIPTQELPADADLSGEPAGRYPAYFAQRLSAELPPEIRVRWQDSPRRRLWVQLRASDDLWFVLPMERADGDFGLVGLLFILVSFAVFPTLGGYVIHRQVETPLKRLSLAARAVSRGQWPEPVPVRGSVELAAVSEAFNGMVATLSRSETAREEMLAGISHDIRTPLTKLRMLLAAPTAFDALNASGERFIEEIDAIVGQFIDFARGAETESPSTGDINMLLENLAADFDGLGHHFALHLASLPPCAYRQVSVQRVLVNLMQNAVVHGRHGLQARTCIEGGYIGIAIEDRGPDLTEESLDLIRRPFQRGARASGPGSGLGLAIADRIARQHGGRLELALARPTGLCATLWLPIEPEA